MCCVGRVLYSFSEKMAMQRKELQFLIYIIFLQYGLVVLSSKLTSIVKTFCSGYQHRL